MSDGLVLITGSNGGLGVAIANALAAEPESSVTALFMLRSLSKAAPLESTLSVSSQPYQFMSIDMSNLASIRESVASISRLISSGSLPHIRGLICTAAVMQVGGKQVTEDEMEATFQVNYLANFLLVLRLLPVMRRDCRILFLTSNLILDEGELEGSKITRFTQYLEKLPDAVQEEKGRGKVFSEGTTRYAISKVLLSMFAAELQRRLDASDDFSGINVVLLDPGTFVSGMLNEYPPVIRSLAIYVLPLLIHLPVPLKRLIKTNFTSADEAARNVLKLVLDRNRSFLDASGKAFAWGLEEMPLPADAQNAELCAELWKKSVAWAKIRESKETVLLAE